MLELEDVSVRIANFKCFSTPQGLDKICPVNIIIGRNNSGKSTVLDMLEYATSPSQSFMQLGHKGNKPQCVLSCEVTPELLETVRIDTAAPGVPEFSENAPQVRGKYLKYEIVPKNHPQRRLVSISPWEGSPSKSVLRFCHQVVHVLGNPFERYQFKRIVSDRDIVPEGDQGSLELRPNGVCATDIVQSYINHEELPSSLIEAQLLGELNSIFEPDAVFTRILVQYQKNSKTWEIWLEEPKKGRVPMSRSGSGVKTVLLVLINLLVWPQLTGKPLSDFLFGFEELENNLHPAVQRRLFAYLRRKAVEQNCHFFLSTHSNVVIDLFGQDDQAQIVHVTHDGESAQVAPVSSYLQGQTVLTDLGVRASDLLQSNVVVWVEGPSDRIYFNRWIELWSGGSLSENAHYQCLPYGGSNIAHVAFDDPDVIEEMIQALRVNSHAIVLMDSDKREEDSALKTHVERVVGEVGEVGGVAWVTAGREVENYIPCAALNALYGKDDVDLPDQYADFYQQLEGIQQGQGYYRDQKVRFARRVSPHITREGIGETLDMTARLDEVCKKIREWNGLDLDKE